jgi:hypothetical protein
MGVFTLLIVLGVQIIPHTGHHFDTELSKTIDFEDTDTDEKDSEEESKKYTQDPNESMRSSSSILSGDFYFLNRILSGPVLETSNPPPDWI